MKVRPLTLRIQRKGKSQDHEEIENNCIIQFWLLQTYLIEILSLYTHTHTHI